MFLPTKELIIFDLEYTDSGLAQISKSGHPEIIEIGAIKITSDLEAGEEFHSLVRPTDIGLYTEHCQSLTGIDPEALKKAPTWKEIWKEFAVFTDYRKLPLCSWSVCNDCTILMGQYKTSKLTYPHSYIFIDAMTMHWATCWHQGRRFPGWGLDIACEFWDVKRETRHRALPDTRSILDLMRKWVDHKSMGEIEVVAV